MISTNSPYRKKLTKIVATLSDIRCEPAFIRSLYEAGVDVVRFNTAHQTPEGTLKIVESVRSLSDRIPLMLDTKGPEIRTRASFEPIAVSVGDIITVKGGDKESADKTIYVNYDNFVADVPVGVRVLIEEGRISLLVKEKSADSLICLCETNGLIKSKKQVNVPGVSLKLPTLSAKDITYIEFAVKHNLDFIAHSFVRNKEDVMILQKEIDKYKSTIKIIAKIENQEGIDNIEEILDHVYGVMIARGDLGVEVSASQVPMVQKMLIKKCIARSKPVIVATHMLESMIKNQRATRAEVSDVANAVLDGTSALMLSGETAYGDFPVDAVRTMAQTVIEVEDKRAEVSLTNAFFIKPDQTLIMSKAAIQAAIELDAKGIVVPTHSGMAARVLSSFRSKKQIFAKCYDKSVMRELALSYGVHATFFENGHRSTDELVADGLNQLVKAGKLNPEDLVVITARTKGFEKPMPNFLEVNTVKNCLSSRKTD